MKGLQIPENSPDLLTMAKRRGGAQRVYVETYGCQMNVADSELMVGILEADGYVAADGIEDADVILVNTCAVRERAEERVYGRVATLNGERYRRPHVLLGVMGCMAEHLKHGLAERAPYVDMIVGPDAYRRLPDIVAEARSRRDDPDFSQRRADAEHRVPGPIIDVKLDRDETYEGVASVRKDGVNAWITIQRGCDKFCTFCIVPYTRGRERGVPPREILRQARRVAEAGFKEVTLLGQTVNSYRYDDSDFADLLVAVAAVDGIERIRFTSPYPVDFTDKLIATMADLDKVCPYVHLPVQSGSDAMLSRMRRGHTVAEYYELIGKLRTAIPDIALSTDIIVGFPGETDADYEATAALLKDVRFDFAYQFAYSEREGTYAHKRIDDDVPDHVKKRRLSSLIDLQERICAEKMAQLEGQTFDVLIDGTSRRSDDDWVGKTPTFKTTIFPRDERTAIGDIVPVRIDRTTAHTLLGEIAWSS